MYEQEILKEFKDVMKIVEVAKALAISRSQVYRLIREGKLEVFRVGQDYRVPKKSVIALMRTAATVKK